MVRAGFVWVGEMAEARRYLETFRRAVGTPIAEQVDEMRYIDLQSSGDERHHHGLRRYSAGHYLTEFSDAAIDAYLARGVPAGASEPDWALMPGGGFQNYGGAIADVGENESAFSHRRTLVEFFAGPVPGPRPSRRSRRASTSTSSPMPVTRVLAAPTTPISSPDSAS